MDAFKHKNTMPDGSTVYAAPHELNNEVLIVFPSGYWDMSPPSEIRIADFSVSVGVQPLADANPDSPYGVICEDTCGHQGLSEKEYDRQMSKPDQTWICPRCRGFAYWDDDRYDAKSK